MPESEKKNPDPFSKTQRKKDMQALQNIGKNLVDLPLPQLAKVPLPNDLQEAIHFFHTLKTNEAKRRQLQYIGKIMRDVDPEPITKALAAIKLGDTQSALAFHRVEEWRTRLLTEGEKGIEKFMALYPEANPLELRELVRKGKPGATELFRYLRTILNTK